MTRKLILVTGAPRTATTPVGNMLETAQSTVSLYEPLGPTGLKRFQDWFPMKGEAGAEDLSVLFDDLRQFKSGGLKSQQRGKSFSLKRAVFGSRTIHSYRKAKLSFGVDNVIWKDPHAIFMAADVAAAGIPVVLTIRRAKAHASSYRRLGWVSKAVELYPRWQQRFGACDVIESYLGEASDSVVSAALLWRMCYLPLVQAGVVERVHLVSPDDLAVDERGCYESLFAKLDLTETQKTEELLAAKKSDTRSRPSANTTHDWGRSVSAVNSYWRELLTEEDIHKVDAITADIEQEILGPEAS